MSIFSNIISAIVGHAAAAEARPGAPSASASTPPGSGVTTTATPATRTAAATASDAGNTQLSQVDVEGLLTALAAKNSEKLDWRRSIVDMMKLLNLDSSLGARKELAQELHYTGNTNDSAAMNIWLHTAVMQKIAENGGKVPSDLIKK